MSRRCGTLAALSVSLSLWATFFTQQARADPIGGNIAAGIAAAVLQMVVLAIAINVGIGTLEGALVAKIFHLPYARTTGILILGNVVSGFFGLRGFFDGSVRALVISLLTAFVVELPFLFWAMPAGPRRRTDAVKATALVQCASYAVIVAVLAAMDYPFF